MERIRKKENRQEEGEKKAITIVPAVEQAAKILLCLARGASWKMNLTTICNEVGIHKSKGYNILNTLHKFGFIQKDDEEKVYSLGPELITLSREVLNNLDYREVVTPFLSSLAKNTHNTALFGLLNDENVFVVAKHEGEGDISVTIRLGHRFPVTAGAHGKAIVAFLPEGDRKKILKREKLYFHGDVSRLDRARLATELDRCRESGFAFDMGELNPGINAIAAPVFGPHGKLLGAIFVVGTFQEEHVPVYGAKVAAKAKEVSRMLGADVEGLFSKVGSRKK